MNGYACLAIAVARLGQSQNFGAPINWYDGTFDHYEDIKFCLNLLSSTLGIGFNNQGTNNIKQFILRSQYPGINTFINSKI